MTVEFTSGNRWQRRRTGTQSRRNNPAARLETSSRLQAQVTRVIHCVLRATLLLMLLTALPQPNATAQKSAPGPGRERFVPADQLDTIFERSPHGVMLPREEFQELLAKAQLAQAARADIPSVIVVRSAEYDVEQADNHAVVSLSLNLEQFVDQWVTLQIPIGNLLVENATIGGDTGRDWTTLQTFRRPDVDSPQRRTIHTRTHAFNNAGIRRQRSHRRISHACKRVQRRECHLPGRSVPGKQWS